MKKKPEPKSIPMDPQVATFLQQRREKTARDYNDLQDILTQYRDYLTTLEDPNASPEEKATLGKKQQQADELLNIAKNKKLLQTNHRAQIKNILKDNKFLAFLKGDKIKDKIKSVLFFVDELPPHYHKPGPSGPNKNGSGGPVVTYANNWRNLQEKQELQEKIQSLEQQLQTLQEKLQQLQGKLDQQQKTDKTTFTADRENYQNLKQNSQVNIEISEASHDSQMRPATLGK